MDAAFLRAYEAELAHLRDMGWEFAQAYEKIAGRLAIDPTSCGDPYVERLLEGFAFLTARVQRKLDDEFFTFTSHLLDIVYPDYLAPTPSMAVVAMTPDLRMGDLSAGFTVPRGARLLSRKCPVSDTRCTFTTAQPVTFWPLRIAKAAYVRGAALSQRGLAATRDVKAALTLQLETLGPVTFDQLALDELPIYLTGSEGVAARLIEAILGRKLGMLVTDAQGEVLASLGAEAISSYGFEDDTAILPCRQRSTQGHRLLKEYFAFPERFAFMRLAGLQPAVRRCGGNRLDLHILFDSIDTGIEDELDVSQIQLFATPVVNLFAKRADPAPVSIHGHEHHVVAERTADMDFEIYSVSQLTGSGSGIETVFRPFFEVTDRGQEQEAYFSLARRPRLPSSRQKRKGRRSSYSGSEVFVTVVDRANAPWPAGIERVSAETLCTNRDLPLLIPLDVGVTHFSIDSGAPVADIRCIAGPTPPRPPVASGAAAWQAINLFALNYRSLVDAEDGGGPEALRTLLSIHAPIGAQAAQRQIEGLVNTVSRPVVRRLPLRGPITFGRGLEVQLTLEERAFAGGSAFLMGAVLDRFMRGHVHINSFVETVVSTVERGEIMRWQARIGTNALA